MEYHKTTSYSPNPTPPFKQALDTSDKLSVFTTSLIPQTTFTASCQPLIPELFVVPELVRGDTRFNCGQDPNEVIESY
ncbi:hypothetical protein KN1_21370 [Stygiolobus caldivivus]|uniref:Uncharacterized protein n=1 Tax=Stygiolobus caldivivus TaxID=2824673 RepID=A0A8D5U6Z8_9CREN|nr:hypothetical protein KN1_21370 [Stygiolobus caldivivus]